MKGTGRIIGVDLARALALVSMFIAHLAPGSGPEGVLNLSEFLTAPLFALLIGVSACLSSEQMGFPALFASSVVRALVLLGLGLYLESWGAQVDIVLTYLGVLSLLLAPLVFLPSWALALLAAASWWFAQSLQAYFTPLYLEAVSKADPLHYGLEWLFTGAHYQAFTLLAYACIGAVLARTLPHWGAGGDAATAVAATGLAALIYWYASTTASVDFLPYSTGRLEIAFSLLLSLAALGWSCLLARLLAARENLLSPLALAGRMTLSLYVFQIGLLALYSRYAPAYGLPARDDSWVFLGGMIVSALFFAWCWNRLLGSTFAHRGPPETPLAWISGRG